MTSLRCLIIDDEPIARKIIREHIEDISFLEIVGEAESINECLVILESQVVDLLFLDIQMPGMNGIEFLERVHPHPMAIMTTAYPDYALQGYELDVMDYLVKPIDFDRFLKAVTKAWEYFKLKSAARETMVLPDAFFIKCNKKIEKIQFSEVLYIEAMANYIIVHTAGKKYITYFTFKGIEEKLPSDLFVRIHKSYLISLNSITRIEGNKAILGKTSLPVSKHFKGSAMEKIEPFLIRRH
jgi:DNA-binding LytR/AlgR family response regulator